MKSVVATLVLLSSILANAQAYYAQSGSFSELVVGKYMRVTSQSSESCPAFPQMIYSESEDPACPSVLTFNESIKFCNPDSLPSAERVITEHPLMNEHGLLSARTGWYSMISADEKVTVEIKPERMVLVSDTQQCEYVRTRK